MSRDSVHDRQDATEIRTSAGPEQQHLPPVPKDNRSLYTCIISVKNKTKQNTYVSTCQSVPRGQNHAQ